MRDPEPVPEYIPVLSRAGSNEFTQPMYLIDHTCARQDGPPELPALFDDEEDTIVEELPWVNAHTRR